MIQKNRKKKESMFKKCRWCGKWILPFTKEVGECIQNVNELIKSKRTGKFRLDVRMGIRLQFLRKIFLRSVRFVGIGYILHGGLIVLMRV